MKRNLMIAFLIVILVGSLWLANNVHFGLAQESTKDRYVINHDMVWKKSQSPYNIDGYITIGQNATLTIEAGNTIYLKGTLQLDGKLIAKGTPSSANTIEIYGGEIIFTSKSQSYNEQTGQGSIIENARVGWGLHIIINGSSPKIHHNDGSMDITIYDGSPTITNNYIKTEITANAGTPIISNNTLKGKTGSESCLFLQTNAIVSDNHFSEAKRAINMYLGTPIIERNLVSKNEIGIAIGGKASPIIANNTIAQNTIGLNMFEVTFHESLGSKQNYFPSPTIINNNIHSNSQYNIYLGYLQSLSSTAGDVDASCNWWGTTDLPIINQTIYDYKNNFNLGTVTYTPILTEPNAQAKPDPDAPLTTPASTTSTSTTPTLTATPTSSTSTQPTTTPAPTPSTSPFPSPTSQGQNNTQLGLPLEIYVAIGVLLVLVGILAAVVIVLLRRQTNH